MGMHAFGIATAMVLLGCASTVVGTQAVGVDASPADVADAVAVDARAPDDAPSACAREPSIDGDARAQREGPDARYVVGAGEMVAGRPRLDDDGCGPRGGATHTFSLRFTVPVRAWLRVSVESPGASGETVDRVVLARGCGLAQQRLACVGAREVRVAEASGPGAVTVRTPDAIEAGETVTVSVGTLPRDAVVRVVALTVARALGDVCDPAEGRDVCASRGRCVRGVCVPEGVREGACRAGAAPCEAGLACVGGTRVGPRGVCARAVVPGAACVRGDVCEGGVCEVVDGAMVCRAAGEALHVCRETAPRCGVGLRCVRGVGDTNARCYRALATNDACGENPVTDGACPEGDRCTARADGALRCLRVGASGGACRASDPPCDAGLACGLVAGRARCVADASSGTRNGPCGAGSVARCASGLACQTTTARCVDALAAGAACTGDGAPCAAGLTCARAADAPPGSARCVVVGAEGGRCRTLFPRCDGGLFCAEALDGRCVRPLAAGASCVSGDATRACDGLCLGGACRPRGTRGGPCREVGAGCDDALVCAATADGMRCVVPLASGAPCVRAAVGEGCVPGTECRLPATSGGTVCQDDGTVAPPCAPDGACDAGRRCVDGLCRPTAADGAVCFGAIACATGSTCVQPRGPTFTGQCVRDGAPGAACRLEGAACDAGSVCRDVAITATRAGWCVFESGEGEVCGTAEPPRLCARGLRCEGARCVR